MRPEELSQPILQAIQNGNLHIDTLILGDQVQHKIDNIEAGGIGVQEIHNHYDKHTPTQTPQAKRAANAYTKATFSYTYAEKQIHRITKLYQHLLKADWIDKNTSSDDFLSLFLGQPSDAKIKWIDSQQNLFYLIRTLTDRKLIAIPKEATIWQITESHFINKKSLPFHHFNKQKDPKRTKPTIDKLADLLDPSIADN